MTTLETIARNAVSTEAHDANPEGLLHAAHNARLKLPGWCSCNPSLEIPEVYFNNPLTNRHGWMCATCHRTTQTG